MKIPIPDKYRFAAVFEWPLSATILKPRPAYYRDKDGVRHDVTDWHIEGLTGDWDRQKMAEILFIDGCLDNGLTFEEIAELIGTSKQNIHRIWRYGLANAFSDSLKRNIKTRQRNRCKICKRSGVKLHVHHIASHRDHKPQNLVALCHQCHFAVEAIKHRLVKAGKIVRDFSYAQPLIDESQRAA